MTARIVGAVLALIAGLLAAVAVPLGLITAAHDWTVFREQTASTAQSLASVAEERIDDGPADPGLRRALHDLAAAGERAPVYDRADRRIAGTGQWTLPADRRPAQVHQLGRGDLDTRAPADGGPAEVRRLAATFNAMAARLQALIHGHRSMMADVSHQVRTPGPLCGCGWTC
jgi:signal transduction histidine kinase